VNRENQPAEVELTMTDLAANSTGALYRLAADGKGIERVDLTVEEARGGHRVPGMTLPPYGVGLAEFRARGAMP